jgi:triosephosphate isomerase
MKYIIGNWKMNGDAKLLGKFGNIAADGVAICLPFHLLGKQPDGLEIGAQDCSAHENGAFTGEISAEMIKSAGANYCIVGHSERRQQWNESNEIVAQKAARCLAHGLIPIICVGETQEEKEAGKTLSVIEDQVWRSIPDINTIKSEIILAYEPVWAIGTGLIPVAPDIEKVHNHIAAILEKMGLVGTKILYGGSVKPANAREIMNIKNVGGVLVGGASLDPNQFKEIIDGR